MASAPGRAGVAVFRVSGSAAAAALRELTGGESPPPRRAVRVSLRDGAGGIIDDGLALWFPGPASFTGEDVAELHLHGGRAVREAVANRLLALGLRPAEAGEFSRRAVLAGKLDLTRAEAIADLVAADTEAQRRQAVAQLAGGLEAAIESWRDSLLRVRAHLEADIDFSDQELPAGLAGAGRGALAGLAQAMAAALAASRPAERLREGFRVALVGPPNAGKSSLFNALAGREAAIVAPTPGTTRDVLELALDLGGYPVIVADTAGLRASPDPVEAEGVRRAEAAAAAADLRLVVVDAAAPEILKTVPPAGPEPEDALVVVNKIDLAPPPPGLAGAILVSARRGDGIDRLVAAVTARAAAALEAGPGIALTRQRHRAAVAEAEAALRRAVAAPLPELVAEDVRVAADALGRITGRVDVEAMLDLIFREFCIGK